MTKYSPEPSRKHLVLYLTFDDLGELDDPLDLSPQGNGTSVVGDTKTAPGSVGQGFDFDGETYVNLPSGIISDTENFTVAFYLDPEDRPDDQRLISLRGDITFFVELDSNNTLDIWTGSSHTIDTDVTEPVHVAITHDATTDETVVRLDGREVLTYTEAIAAGSNSSRLGAAGFDSSFGRVYSTLDEVRVYRRILPDDDLEALYEIGAFHQQIDNLGDAWDNPGIPYRVGAPNSNLAGTLGEAHDYNFRQLDTVRDAIHIDSASGLELDRIGRSHGVLRPTGEGDPVYRARIKAVLASGRSRGTFDDLLEATSVVVEVDEDSLFLDTDDAEPATAFIYVQTSDLEDANLTAGDITGILQDAVPGGHDINVVERGANPFTLIADGDVNDADLALTSDSIATGGGLVSDA